MFLYNPDVYVKAFFLGFLETLLLSFISCCLLKLQLMFLTLLDQGFHVPRVKEEVNKKKFV